MPLTFPQMPDKLTANETTILEYLNRNSNAFLFLNIAQLAAALDVSEATISRFARHVGCRDFKNLKQVVLGQVEQPGPVQKKTAVSAGRRTNCCPAFWNSRNIVWKERWNCWTERSLSRRHRPLPTPGGCMCMPKTAAAPWPSC